MLFYRIQLLKLVTMYILIKKKKKVGPLPPPPSPSLPPSLALVVRDGEEVVRGRRERGARERERKRENN